MTPCPLLTPHRCLLSRHSRAGAFLERLRHGPAPEPYPDPPEVEPMESWVVRAERERLERAGWPDHEIARWVGKPT